MDNINPIESGGIFLWVGFIPMIIVIGPAPADVAEPGIAPRLNGIQSGMLVHEKLIPQ